MPVFFFFKDLFLSNYVVVEVGRVGDDVHVSEDAGGSGCPGPELQARAGGRTLTQSILIFLVLSLVFNG